MCNKLMFLDKNKVVQFGTIGQILKEEGPAQELLKQQLKVISPHFEKDLVSVLRGLEWVQIKKLTYSLAIIFLEPVLPPNTA